jgi:hypothetical protein
MAEDAEDAGEERLVLPSLRIL